MKWITPEACSCTIRRKKIVYCPLHKQARFMFEILRQAVAHGPCWNEKLCGKSVGNTPPLWTCPRCQVIYLAEVEHLAQVKRPPATCECHPRLLLRCPECVGAKRVTVSSLKKTKATRRNERLAYR